MSDAGRIVKFGVEWEWIPADVEREHWLATDGTRIAVFPPSDGYDDFQVYTPVVGSDKEMVVHLAAEMEDEAFRYAARARLSRPN